MAQCMRGSAREPESTAVSALVYAALPYLR